MLSPYNRAAVITKSDTADFVEGLCAAIYCGGAGVVQVVFQDDQVVPFTVVAGQLLPLKAKRVNSTDTTATLMNALFFI